VLLLPIDLQHTSRGGRQYTSVLCTHSGADISVLLVFGVTPPLRNAQVPSTL
jgi:hypothetical protein